MHVNLMQLLSGTGELCGIEYFKLVFLKYINVPTWLIFAGLVTFHKFAKFFSSKYMCNDFAKLSFTLSIFLPYGM